jgi:hypothetical protein
MNEKVLFALVLTGGVVGAGVVDFTLSRLGYADVGMVVWALGYGGTILLVWAVWFRPLDIDGEDPGIEEWE